MTDDELREKVAKAIFARLTALPADVCIDLADAAIAAVREAEGWQPIETAPKDGTWLLLWDDEGGGESWTAHIICRWRSGQWMNEGNDISPHNPTHWMPLPEPPALQETGE